MKLLLEVKDSKPAFLMELLNSLSFVKTKPLTDYKAKVLADLKEAVDEMKLINEGKLSGRRAEDLF
jgi:hypothetical protein